MVCDSSDSNTATRSRYTSPSLNAFVSTTPTNQSLYLHPYVAVIYSSWPHHSSKIDYLQWGWPQPDGSVGSYYVGSYQQIVSMRYRWSNRNLTPPILIHSSQDPNVHLVDTSGWVTYADIFPEYTFTTPFRYLIY